MQPGRASAERNKGALLARSQPTRAMGGQLRTPLPSTSRFTESAPFWAPAPRPAALEGGRCHGGQASTLCRRRSQDDEDHGAREGVTGAGGPPCARSQGHGVEFCLQEMLGQLQRTAAGPGNTWARGRSGKWEACRTTSAMASRAKLSGRGSLTVVQVRGSSSTVADTGGGHRTQRRQLGGASRSDPKSSNLEMSR